MVNNIAVNVLGGGAEMQGTATITRSDIPRHLPHFPRLIWVPPPSSLIMFVGNVSAHEANMTEPSQKDSVRQNATEGLPAV